MAIHKEQGRVGNAKGSFDAFIWYHLVVKICMDSASMKLSRFVPEDLGKETKPFIPGPLANRRKRVKLRDAKHVKLRRAYKKRKPKKTRIHCKVCGKRFVPRRITAIFCGPLCRNQWHYLEHKYFNKYGLVREWDSLPEAFKSENSRSDYLRSELNKVLRGIRESFRL